MIKQPDILIIDDEESILNLVGIILESRGYTVARASDALQGMTLVASLKPELVVLDYMMPGMDGMEALTRIKTGFPDTYVIMFTGKGNEQIAVELMKAGRPTTSSNPSTIRTL